MSGTKQDVIAALKELAELTLLDEQDPSSFRVRAYERAIAGVQELGGDLAGMDEKALQAVSGVGKSTAAKIKELLTTGRMEKLEALRLKYPPAFRRLMRIPDMGP